MKPRLLGPAALDRPQSSRTAEVQPPARSQGLESVLLVSFVDRWFWALIKLLVALLVLAGIIWSTYWLIYTFAIETRTGTVFLLFFMALALMVSLFFTFKPKKSNQEESS